MKWNWKQIERISSKIGMIFKLHFRVSMAIQSIALNSIWNVATTDYWIEKQQKSKLAVIFDFIYVKCLFNSLFMVTLIT